MSQPLVDPSELERLLGQLLTPGTEAIRESEEALRRALGQPQFVVDLFAQIQHSSLPQVRQLAAVLVRRRITAHWPKLDVAVRAQLQAVLLARLPIEPERAVRRSITSVAGVIARYALPRGEWSELLAFLSQCAQSATAEHRELAMVLLSALLESDEVVESTLRPHFPMLAATLQALLADHANPPVRRAALKAVSAWCGVVDQEVDARVIKPLIPPLLELCKAAATSGDEETLVLAFQILYDLIESQATFVNAHLPAILELALALANAPSMEVETRVVALNVVGCALAHKKKTIVKHKLVPALTMRLLEACATTDASGAIEDDEDDEDEVSVHRRAAQVFHTLGVSIPSKHAVPAILDLVRQHHCSEHLAWRRAVLVALAMTAEGCAEAYADALDALLPVVFAGCRDGAQPVREAACICIGEFACYLQPDIISHYQEILPHIFMVLNDATERVKEKSCYALESFCENLGDDIVPFLQPLLERLTALLRDSTRATQEMAISALAAVAMSAGKQFRPYFETIYSLVRVLLHQTGAGELTLRARALECIGLMNLAVGREVCEPVLPEVTAAALEGLQLDLPELREYTYGFFAQLSELLQGDVAPILPQLLPRVLQSLDFEDCIDFGDDDKPPSAMAALVASINAKGASGAPAADSGAADVRSASCKALGALVTATAKAEGVPAWTKGMASVSYNLPPATRALLEKVVPILLEHFGEDDDKDTVAAASEALTDIINLLGPAAATPLAAQLCEVAIALLSKGHACMQEEEEDTPGAEAEPDDDVDDHDASLWEAVSDLLTTLPKVMGEYYLMHFAKLVPQLEPYLSAQHPAGDRSLAVGILAESLHQLELSGAGFLPMVLPHAVRLSSDANSTARQNATFCLGILGQFGGPAAIDVMQTLLTALQPRLADEEASVCDNGVASLARLVLAFGATLPLASILPAIVTRLPLRADSGENRTCCRALMRIAQDDAARAHLAPHVPQMLAAFSEMLMSEGERLATEELKGELRAFLIWIVGVAPELRASLPAALQQAL